MLVEYEKKILDKDITYFQVDKFTAMFEICAEKCVDRQIEYLPSLLKQIKASLVKDS